MAMGARIIETTTDPAHVEEFNRLVQQHLLPAGKRAEGYLGYVGVDRGNGQRLAIWVYDSVEAAEASREDNNPLVREHLTPLIKGEPKVTVGTVFLSDGGFAGAAS